jgi:hypothetical protein
VEVNILNSCELYDAALAQENKEDYLKAIKYYTLHAANYPDSIDCYTRISYCLKKLGYDNSYIEGYLNDNFTISEDKYNLFMSSIYYNLHEYKDSLKFALVSSDPISIKIKIMCLYNLKEYLQCLGTIIDNYSILDHYYLIAALCCILLCDEFPESYYNELLLKLKRDKLFSLLDAYNFFAFESVYYGDPEVVETFCSILINSSNIKCIKYIRMALENISTLKYADIAVIAFNNNFFYLCDEILNIYCSEIKNHYALLLLKAKVLFKLGNINECQKYLSYAGTLNDSDEFHKLRCLCKIIECIGVINSNKDASKIKSIEKALGYLEEAKNYLL